MGADIEEKRAELLRLKMEKLKKKCKDLKLSTEGGKMEMINRIIDKLYIRDIEDGETWDRYDDLKLSDDDDDDGVDQKEMKKKKSRESDVKPPIMRGLSVPL